MKTGGEWTVAELEAQYDNRARRTDSDQVMAEWQARSDAFRATANGRLDLAYGPGPRDRLDYFPAVEPGGALLVYIHGGYWQRGDKSLYSFVAAPFVERGIGVTMVNYDLCPAVRLAAITPQLRRALAWLWQAAPELGFSPARLHLMGHSAGGHLASMMMAVDWPALDAALPADLVKSAIPISGLYELEPLRRTSINELLGLDQEEAMAESPLSLRPATDAPQLVVVGGEEPSEWHRQADLYASSWGREGPKMTRYDEPGVDHFDVVNRLADPESGLFRRSLTLLEGYTHEQK